MKKEVFGLKPNKDWILEFESNGFKIEVYEEHESGDSVYYYATNKKTGINLSITIERAPLFTTSKECRNSYWGRAKESPYEKENIKMWELEQLAIVEHFAPKVKGIDINQKHLNAYCALEDVWIDIHLSKVFFEPKEQKLFLEALNKIIFNDSYCFDVNKLLGLGSYFYLENNLENAILYYQRTLDLEKEAPQLEKDYFKVLIDNLAISYGMSGYIDKSIETTEYGIKTDPTYPMFYYNLACAYAEMDNLNKTIKNLEKVAEYKNNMIEGEVIPNPKEDDSFERYLGEEKFLKIASKIY